MDRAESERSGGALAQDRYRLILLDELDYLPLLSGRHVVNAVDVAQSHSRWGRVDPHAARSPGFVEGRQVRKIGMLSLYSVRQSSLKFVGVGVKIGVNS
jgi:hypothetical protein